MENIKYRFINLNSVSTEVDNSYYHVTIDNGDIYMTEIEILEQ